MHIASVDGLDHCPDLAIGAPGSAGGGAVYLVRGNGAGVDTAFAWRIASPSADARFGATVGVVAVANRARANQDNPGAPDPAEAGDHFTFTWKTAKNLGEKVAGTRYGWTLPGAS